MRAGALDRLVYLEHAERPFPRDAANQPQPVFSTALQCWAERQQVRGAEQLAGGQTVARQEVTFRIRYPWQLAALPTPDESWRLKDRSDGNRVYDLVRVEEIGRREGLLITATARAE
jgi:head-tail adaptor